MPRTPPIALACALGFMVLAACGEESASIRDEADASADGRAPSDLPDSGIAVSPDAAVDGSVPKPPPDPCATATPVCPTTTTTVGSGVVAIDRCAFPIDEATTWTSLPPLVTALEKIAAPATTATILADLNRTATAVAPGAVAGGPAGVDIAVRWGDEEENSVTWIPQGITGSADANAAGLVDGRRVVLVSWYYTPPAGSTYEKGARVAFVDVTNPLLPTYRLALLVEPTGTTAAPSFAPVKVHAGGLAWVGNLLYVVETGKGFRVFDMSRAMTAATDIDEIGCQAGVCRAGLYKYVVPQIGGYTTASACAPLFSYVALDKTTTPPSLLSGEYCGGAACAAQPLAGRAYRWPLSGAGGKLAAGTSWPSEAMLLGQTQVQGAASRSGVYYLSSSAPAGGGGALYRVKTGKSATSTWLDAPEDLMVDETNGLLWTISEAAGSRFVAGLKLTSYPPPP
jgi:hypothetical protein